MAETKYNRIQNRSIGSPPRFAVVAGAIVILSVVSGASGQHALGRGDALDRNLSPTTGGRNLPRAVEDFRSRNLLITGNVVGGRGFRDSVGYSAAQDFRGELGADDLFEFRAQSAWSSPELARTGAVADQFQFGQSLGLLEYRRSATGATPRTIGEAPGGEDHWWSEQLRTNRQQLDELTVYSSIGRTLEISTEPAPIGVTYGEDGAPFVVSASPLRGIAMTSMEERAITQGLTTYDLARIRDDVIRQREIGRIGRSFEFQFERLFADPTLTGDPGEGGRAGAGVGGGMDAEYIRILERIAQRYAEANNTTLDIDRSLLNQLDETYAELRQQLEALRASSTTTLEDEYMQGADGEETPPSAPRTPESARDETRIPRMTLPGQEKEDTAPRQPRTIPEVIAPDAPRVVDPLLPEIEDDEDERENRGLALDEIAFILRHGQPIERLTPAEQTRFNELMGLAEESLRSGDYFMAERRFLRALRFTPGHPMASLGLAHSQLGAGLHLSAALSLRRLLSEHPELIDVSVSADLLPPRERLDEIVRELEMRLPERRDRAAYGFLLAYIGRQAGERARIEQGLSVLGDAAPDDPLQPLLERIWLGDDENGTPAINGRPSPEAEPNATAGPETSDPEK